MRQNSVLTQSWTKFSFTISESARDFIVRVVVQQRGHLALVLDAEVHLLVEPRLEDRLGPALADEPDRRRVHDAAEFPGMVSWGICDSAGRGGNFLACRTAYLQTLQNYLKISAKNLDISGHPLTSENYLGFPEIQTTFNEHFGENM